MTNITDQDEDEFIAIQIGSDIYFGQAAIDKCIEMQGYNCLHPRSTFKLMAELDLDPKWDEYAEYPTIFKLSEVDKFYSQK